MSRAALALSGATLLGAGGWLGLSAAEAMLEGASRLVARDRDLDAVIAILRPAGAGRAEEILSARRDAASNAAEREALEGALAALSSADAGRAVEHIERARAGYAAELERAWDEGASGERWAVALMLAGAVLCAASAAGVRRARSGGAATQLDSAAEPDTRGIEELLRARLEDLYATRLEALESERLSAYGELAAGLHHGLKTPLAGVRAAAQLAQKKIGTDHPAFEQLEDIVVEIDGLVDGLRRLLDTAVKGDTARGPTPPSRLVEAIDRACGDDARARGIRWAAGADSDLPDVEVDPALVEIALRNLVDNALAASREGAPVEVRARARDGGAWVDIAVHDGGPGLPERSGAGSTKPGGNGLGLALARRIAARQGGVLVLESDPSSGTTATLRLPAAVAAREEACA